MNWKFHISVSDIYITSSYTYTHICTQLKILFSLTEKAEDQDQTMLDTVHKQAQKLKYK